MHGTSPVLRSNWSGQSSLFFPLSVDFSEQTAYITELYAQIFSQALKIEAAYSSGTLVLAFRPMQCPNPQDRRLTRVET
jgi:hypothetical protein